MFNFESVDALKTFLAENKATNPDIQNILKEVAPQEVNTDIVSKYLTENEDGKKFFDSQKDKHFSTSLETWKKNNLDKIVQDKLKEMNPDLSPEALRIKELETKFENAQKEINREKLKIKAMDYAKEKGLPFNFVDKFIGDDEETTNKNMETFETMWKQELQAAVEQQLKGAGRNLPPKQPNNKQFTMEEISKMSEADLEANWDIIQEILNKNKKY